MMKRILFFIESLSGGGAEKVLVTHLNHLDYRKYDITLLSFVDTGILKSEIDFNKVHYRSVIRPSHNRITSLWNNFRYKCYYSWLPAKYVSKLIIPNQKFDILVAFSEGFPTKIIAKVSGKKVAWVHIDLLSFPWTQNKGIFRSSEEERCAYQQFDRVVCVSKAVDNVMTTYYGLSNTQTIYNPIDADDIFRKADLPDDMIRDNCFSIISVGRLTRQKGYDLLIPIIGRIKHSGFDATLTIIGEGDERRSLEQMISEQDLSDSVFLTGYNKNPYPIMRQADLFVCPSRAEGFSLVIAEALLLGLPVVSMACAGPEELLGNGKFGYLCRSYDELEKVLIRAASDVGFVDNLRHKAMDWLNTYDSHQILSQIERLFDSL